MSNAIGKTPVVRLARAAGGADVRVKLETRSPTAGAADRVARALLELAQPSPQSVVREGGDGVLAVALALACAERQVTLAAWVPESSSLEARQALRALGVTLQLTPHTEGAQGALDRARAAGPLLRDAHPEAFDHAARALMAELRQTVDSDGGRCDAVAVGADSGALVRAALAAFPDPTQTLAVVVEDGRVAHRLAGLGFKGAVPNSARVMPVTDAFGWAWRDTLARSEGLLLSPASAAAVGVAIEFAQARGSGPVYALAADTGERFFSLKDTF